LEKDYHSIAEQIGLRSQGDPDRDIFTAVHSWLSSGKSGKWLLVIDNADDHEVFLRPSRRDPGGLSDVSRSLPQSENGAILITTRYKEVARKLVEEDEIIDVKPINPDEAEQLFHNKLGQDIAKDGVPELAHELDYMPLAIIQAAAYIRKRADQCTVRRYLSRFRQSEQDKVGLLDIQSGQLRRDKQANNSIIRTWQISFEHISNTRPTAADLLSLMSFFDRQGIPKSVLRNRKSPSPQDIAVIPHITGGNPNGDLVEDERSSRHMQELDGSFHPDQEEKGEDYVETDEEQDEDEDNAEYDEGLEDDIQMLRDYSFISATTDRNTFEMHALVQLSMRTWLKSQSKYDAWMVVFVHNLLEASPEPVHVYFNLHLCRRLFPHMSAAYNLKPRRECTLHEWGKLMCRAGWAAMAKGSYMDAKSFFEKMLDGFTQPNAHGTVNRALALDGISISLTVLGDYVEAEKYVLRSIEMWNTVGGYRDPKVLRMMMLLADNYLKQGRWQDAERILQEILSRAEADSVEGLRAKGRLARVYSAQDRHTEAAELQETVLKKKKAKCGQDHWDTHREMVVLAHIYRDMGRLEEAEALLRDVVEWRQKHFGKEHPGTLESLHSLALIYLTQGRCAEAEGIFAMVWKEGERSSGKHHGFTLASMHNLAVSRYRLGRRADAIALMEDCVKLRKATLPPENPGTLIVSELLQQWREEQDTSVVRNEQEPVSAEGEAHFEDSNSSE
jgi:tetratricopeptide (TPR) repeat protein